MHDQFFDKRSKAEALAASETDTGGPTQSVCGNLLQTFRDKPKQWDAWNIDADLKKNTGSRPCRRSQTR